MSSLLELLSAYVVLQALGCLSRPGYAIQATRSPAPWVCGEPEMAGW